MQIRLIKNKLHYIAAHIPFFLIQVQMNGYRKFDLYVFAGLIKSQAYIAAPDRIFHFYEGCWKLEIKMKEKKHFMSVKVKIFFTPGNLQHS